MFKKLFAIAALVSIGSGALYAQADGLTTFHTVTIGIPKVALIDLNTSNPTVALDLDTPTEAGLKFESTATDNTVWLNYSSIVSGTGIGADSRTIQVKMTNKKDNGVTLKMLVAGATGGTGTVGTVTGGFTAATPLLNGTDQLMIEDIGSCYTGDGSNGHQLTYSLAITDVSKLRYDQDDNVTLTFTLSNN